MKKLLQLSLLCIGLLSARGQTDEVDRLNEWWRTMKTVEIKAWLFDEKNKRLSLEVQTSDRNFIVGLTHLFQSRKLQAVAPMTDLRTARVIKLKLIDGQRDLMVWITDGQYVCIENGGQYRLSYGEPFDRLLLGHFRKHWHLVRPIQRK